MSDSINASRGLIVGTAGHIDHGKTSLVRALTGIDTDRLAEEKKRGISIDLGFAHLTLPSGHTVSFIDVPGHERFIKNMLAGVGGIQSVMLVVAADESVMPQTREHFEICRLLGISSGIVVLTKADLATPEQIRKTTDDVRELCNHSFLAAAPIIPASTVTHTGLAQILQELEQLNQNNERRRANGLPRLHVDRSFTLKGFGTVVTGTLLGETLRTGETVFLHPNGKQARIRGLQVHGKPVDVAHPGERTAVNLSGVEVTEVIRGNTLTNAAGLHSTTVLDVQLEWLPGHDELTAREEAFVHLGTAEISARVKLMDASRRFARLWLSQPILSFPSDRFIIRRASPAATIAGGSVVDPFPPKRLNRAQAVRRWTVLSDSDLHARLEFLVSESANGKRIPDLVRMTGVDARSIIDSITRNPNLHLQTASQITVSHAWIRTRRESLLNWLGKFHQDNPSKPGAPAAAARLGLTAELFGIVLEGFAAVRSEGDIIALASFRPHVTDQEARDLVALEAVFRNGGFAPPAMSDALAPYAKNPAKGKTLLESLIKSRRLVRVAGEMIFHADVVAHIRDSLRQHKGRRFSVPEFKEWTNLSRKHAIPLLEYLDREHVTRREGDNRIVL